MEYPSAHKGSYVRRKSANGKRSGPRRTRDQISKDARALDLYCQGKTYQQVADIIGWKSAATALMACKRAIADRQVPELDQIDNYAVATELLKSRIAGCQEIIDRTHYVVSNTGKLVTGPDGEPLVDTGPKLRAITEQRHLQAELNKLQGNYAPTKVRQEVVTEDVVDREIAKLAKELADAQGKPPPPES